MVIAGPTASGKTTLATELALKLNTEIVSADSRQIYKELNIGVAKPSATELASVLHHFIGTASVNEGVSAGKYEMQCIPLLDKLFEKHSVVIMAGGSGLYIDAVCSGFDELPLAKTGTREELARQLREKGLSHLQEMLKDSDPEYYEEVDLQNPHRVMRALEICSTGIKYSELRKGRNKTRNFDSIVLSIDIQREELYQRIDKRVEKMMDAGLLDEVRSLIPNKHLLALQTFGYTELFEHLEGNISLEDSINKIRQNTRNYAKRQSTWFRKKTDHMIRNATDALALIEKAQGGS